MSVACNIQDPTRVGCSGTRLAKAQNLPLYKILNLIIWIIPGREPWRDSQTVLLHISFPGCTAEPDPITSPLGPLDLIHTWCWKSEVLTRNGQTLQARKCPGCGTDAGLVWELDCWLADLVRERTREREGEKQAEHQFDKRISWMLSFCVRPDQKHFPGWI